jgi:hypothetical protein
MMCAAAVYTAIDILHVYINRRWTLRMDNNHATKSNSGVPTRLTNQHCPNPSTSNNRSVHCFGEK